MQYMIDGLPPVPSGCEGCAIANECLQDVYEKDLSEHQQTQDALDARRMADKANGQKAHTAHLQSMEYATGALLTYQRMKRSLKKLEVIRTIMATFPCETAEPPKSMRGRIAQKLGKRPCGNSVLLSWQSDENVVQSDH